MGPMLFSWQNKRTGDPVKMFKHKKRHEAQYATPTNAEVIMKRLGYQAASAHHTESILPVSRWNVKKNCGKSGKYYTIYGICY